LPIDIDDPLGLVGLLVGFVVYALGGLRFRRWAVAGRSGQPRFPETLETVLLWLVYSLAISFLIVAVLQLLRDR